jgi:hypothetical protein
LEEGKEGLQCKNEVILKNFRREAGDDFDILGGGAEQALLADARQPSHLGVAVSVQLFGVGEAALDGSNVRNPADIRIPLHHITKQQTHTFRDVDLLLDETVRHRSYYSKV